ncbi:CATRA conflict system CASPASE/TPR repeat-associated protein [Saccharothrix lopnurensis]|uniref:CATRA conflict system CASPASE/TPR repeat-associated protein n=1 Tax=Saccharothrix lopnurensis TaxID=1670621 RepID=A0ABW1P6E9_9PSEU
MVHVFATLRGKNGTNALAGLNRIWDRCRHILGTTAPVPRLGLPTRPPVDIASAPEGALAAAQDGAVNTQVVLRRTTDAANLSVIISSTACRRPHGTAPPGWIEFDAIWDEIARDDTRFALGVVRVHQGKRPAGNARAALPERVRDVVHWHRRRGFLLWEPEAGPAEVRDVVVLADVHEDAELTAWTWSRGKPEMPRLARYLLQAAVLRHHIGVWRRDEPAIADLHDRAIAHVEALYSGAEPAPHRLHRNEVALRAARHRLERMRTSVEVTHANMAALEPEPLPGDDGLTDWFLTGLDASIQRLDRALELVKDVGAGVPAPRTPSAPRSGVKTLRMGFALDAVDYSSRTTPAGERVQSRISDLVRAALSDLDLDLSEVDSSGTGDGLMMFLPSGVDVQRALPALLRAMAEQLRLDNTVHRDRLRLRMAVDVGPVTTTALGFGGKVATSLGRLLDSEPLRGAIRSNPVTDLAVIVSDRLHGYVVEEGARGTDPASFLPVEVAVKTFYAKGWLWLDPRGEDRDPDDLDQDGTHLR